jgi:DNA-binding HxlR family transcriptional regulator
MAITEDNDRIAQALALLGNRFDPEIEESFTSISERILAQALENVELAERRLRQIQELVGDVALAASN